MENDKYGVDAKHFVTLLNLISSDLGIERCKIVDFELSLFDAQPSGFFGLHKEFISSGRLDNLGSSLVSLDSLIDLHKAGAADNSECNMILLFDHEEIGS